MTQELNLPKLPPRPPKPPAPPPPEPLPPPAQRTRSHGSSSHAFQPDPWRSPPIGRLQTLATHGHHPAAGLPCIGGGTRPTDLLDLAAKRSHFHGHPALTGGYAPSRAPNEGIKQRRDHTWHFAKRVTPPNTISQRRRKWRRKSANSCAATS